MPQMFHPGLGRMTDVPDDEACVQVHTRGGWQLMPERDEPEPGVVAEPVVFVPYDVEKGEIVGDPPTTVPDLAANDVDATQPVDDTEAIRAELAERYEKMHVDDLRDELGNRGLAKSGNKGEMVDRLVDAQFTTDPAATPARTDDQE
jgi:hypothetical protein